MKKIALIAGAAALMSLGTMTVPAMAQTQTYSHALTTVQFGAPPPPRAERVPAPRRGYVWAPGHYEWRGNRYAWVRGTWLKARPGYAYQAPRWAERDGRWEYRGGRWDRDGDGVPNRMDRDRDNDGVRNRDDRRPNNPNRS